MLEIWQSFGIWGFGDLGPRPKGNTSMTLARVVSVSVKVDVIKIKVLPHTNPLATAYDPSATTAG